jgi:hypothetical protein
MIREERVASELGEGQCLAFVSPSIKRQFPYKQQVSWRDEQSQISLNALYNIFV